MRSTMQNDRTERGKMGLASPPLSKGFLGNKGQHGQAGAGRKDGAMFLEPEIYTWVRFKVSAFLSACIQKCLLQQLFVLKDDHY